MKVNCVNKSVTDSFFNDNYIKLLIEGNEYTVIGDGYDSIFETEYYVLQELKSNKPHGGFRKSRFIPLSTIDETQMQRNIDTINITTT